jgi:DNA-binding IclR family transcriptional regulator
MARPAPGAERSVAVLELLAAHPDERFTLSEVARRCDLNKATAHALLSALSERGVLLRHPAEKRYSLGPVLVSIGEAARRGYTASDFVGPTLDDLATQTDLWVRAWRADGDHIGVVAESGRPSVLPAGGAVHLPLIPPIGALGMAFADPATVEAWLARAPSGECARAAAAALPVIREQGFIVVRSNPEWRELTGAGARPSPVTDAGSLRRALAAATGQDLILTDLDWSGPLVPSEVAAPVFGWNGAVDLCLSVTTTSDEAVPAPRIREWAAAVVAAAARLTDLARGVAP